MQNINNYSFFYIPNAMSFYTYIPMTPSISDISTPMTENVFSPQANFVFPSNLDTYYLAHQPKTVPQNPITTLNQCPCSPTSLISKNTPENVRKQKQQLEDPCQPLASLKEEEEWNGKKQQASQNYLLKGEKSVVKSRREEKKRQSDQDYNPEGEKAKKNISKYQINQNRNVVPNQINQVFSFVQKQNKSGYLTARLFQKYDHPDQFTVKRFYYYQSLLKNRLGHYSNERSLRIVNELYDPKCENWSEQEQRFYNKICRILIHHFLYEDSIFIILTSKRMKKEKKSDHLRARRAISASVTCILRGN